MSTVSPTATSPIRSRAGNPGGRHHTFNEGNEYDPSLSPYSHPAPPPYHHNAPRPGFFRAPHDFWPPDPHGGGYWGPPPPYEGSTYLERPMPPPSRRPRNTFADPPQRPTGAKYDEQEHHSSLRRVPSSPGGSYSRGSYQMNRGGRKAHLPRRVPASATNKKDGDALSILANVSADMDGNDEKHAPPHQHSRHVPIPAPTSPLQRRMRPSPITPSHTPQDRNRVHRHQVTSVAANRFPPDYPSAWEQPLESGIRDYPMSHQTPKRRRYMSHHGEYSVAGYYEGAPPALVEHGDSFDSQGDQPTYKEYPYSSTPSPSRSYYYEDFPPSFGGYWEARPHGQGPHIPPRWNYGPPLLDTYRPDYLYEGHDDAFVPHHPPPPLNHASPYTYVQQPRLEEKTILKKKFSWKHYPEVSENIK